MKELILERDHTSVNFVKRSFRLLATKWSMKEFILERNHISANFVKRNFVNLMGKFNMKEFELILNKIIIIITGTHFSYFLFMVTVKNRYLVKHHGL